MASNPFGKFKTKTKKVKIEALDGATVTIQELTVAQSTDFYKRVVKGFITDPITKEAKADLDYNELADIKLEKVSASMLEPYMSLEQLKELSSVASPAIEEIAIAIDNFGEEEKK